MELTISVPPDSEAKLKQRAAASGVDLATYVSQLLQHFTEPPTPLEEISGPIYQRFLASGMTDDELSEELERAKHEMRASDAPGTHHKLQQSARRVLPTCAIGRSA